MSKKYITKEITTMVIDCFICDQCGKEYRAEYETVEARHTDWGNDSVDSYSNYDVCSPKCFKNKVANILIDKNYKNYDTYINDIHHIIWSEFL